MTTGVHLLQDTERTLYSACACDRERCRFCSLRGKIREYLDCALQRDPVPTEFAQMEAAR